MSRGRRERRTEQGHFLGEGSYDVTNWEPSLLRWFNEDESLYPDRIAVQRVRATHRGCYVTVVDDKYLFDKTELHDFVKYVCPRLQERRELQATTRRLREEREQLRQQLQGERLSMSEANQRLREENERLRRELQDERRRASAAEEKASDGCTRTVLAPRTGHAVRFMM